MAAVSSVIAATLSAASIGLTVEGTRRQEADADEQQEAIEEANQRRRAQAKIQNAESRRRAVAALLQQQARAEAAGAASGATGASGFEGAASSIAAGTASNIGQQVRQEQLGFEASAFEQQAQEAGIEGRIAGSKYNLLSSFAAQASGQGDNAGEVLGSAANKFLSKFTDD